jgi:hypothetical protein
MDGRTEVKPKMATTAGLKVLILNHWGDVFKNLL